MDVKKTYNSVDQVIVSSGKSVLVFNIGSYRLIAAAHFKTGNLYVLRFLTHAEYDKNDWKNEL